MNIKIVIDSASDISLEEAEKLGVTVIPMSISFGFNEEYYDGVDITPHRFYEKLIESDELPKTSQINAFRFNEVFKELTSDGSDVLVITISSKLSGTYTSALQAAEKYGNVHVVDSLNACIGERLLCLYALELIKKGLSIEEIVEELNEKKKKINLIAVVNTLEYLKKGGRVSSAVAFAGEAFSIKPVLSVIDGEVKMIGKAVGSKRGNNLLNTLVAKKGGIDFSMPYGVIWSGLDNTMLQKYIKDSAHLWEEHTDTIPAYIIGSTIGTHVGPGAIGVAFFEK
ncbi:MAG: DegV family protein [Bacilli bacterium]|nr:DegV family protein [Bacilli bacterium]